MTTVAARPFAGTYRARPFSTFAFAVRHSGVFWFRGAFTDVSASLRGAGDDLALEGAARVGSISVTQPPVLRANLLGEEFFDAEHHPEVAFRSTAIRLEDDGRAEVEGELTLRGVTRPVAARGEWAAPRPAGFGDAAGLRLGATIDRRDFGLLWQAPLPGGGDAVAWDVRIEIDLLLVRDEEEPLSAA